MQKIKGDEGRKKTTLRYIVVQRSSSICLLHSSMVLKPSGNNHNLSLFRKFDRNIFIIMKYHTIISYVDADTQTANNHKIFNNFNSITLLSIITRSKSLYVAIHLDPVDLFYKDCH